MGSFVVQECCNGCAEEASTGKWRLCAFDLNPITNQMKLTYQRSAVSIPDIQAAVKRAGGTAVLVAFREEADPSRPQPAPC